MKISPYLQIVLLILITLGVYQNALDGAFLWDDLNFISNNTTIKSVSRIPTIFTHYIGHGGPGDYAYYRPLQELSYLMDFQIWHDNVFGYHLTSVLIHILVGICLYHLIFLVSKNIYLSFYVSLFFLIHPIQSEVVSCVSGRGEPLAALFILLSLIIYIKNLDQKRWGAALGLILFSSLALLSKESALILPLLILSYHYSFKRKLEITQFLPVVIGVSSYFLLRVTLLQSSFDILKDLYGWQTRIPGFFYAFLKYFRLLLWPFDLHFDYGQTLLSFQSPIALTGLGLFLILIFISHKIRHRYPLCSWAILWFIICLLPYSNLIRLFDFMSDHFLYSASIGFFIVAVVLAQRFIGPYEQKFLPRIFLALVIIFYCSLTIIQNIYWNNPIYFYQRTLRYNPLSWSSYINLGTELFKRRDVAGAIKMYQRALAIKPSAINIYQNLGSIYLEINQLELAKKYLLEGLRLQPRKPLMLNSLGIIAQMENRTEDAINYFYKAIEIKNDYLDAYNNVGLIYIDTKDYEKAMVIFQKMIEIDHQDFRSYYYLGLIHLLKREYDQSSRYFEQSQKLSSANKQIYYYLALNSIYLGKADKAQEWLKEGFAGEERQKVYGEILASFSKRPEGQSPENGNVK